MNLLVKKHHPQYSIVKNKLFLLAPTTSFFLTCTQCVQAVTKKMEKEKLNVTNILAFNLVTICQVSKDVLPLFNCTMILHY
jgi:hypothetical protein